MTVNSLIRKEGQEQVIGVVAQEKGKEDPVEVKRFIHLSSNEIIIFFLFLYT